MLDLWLIFLLGFLGSFGHCLGMCGPLAVAFSLSGQNQTRWDNLRFQILLNLGRVISYTLVGAAIGGVGAVVLASGQIAGIGSDIRRWLAIITGLMLIWFGLQQINPNLLPVIPFLHPLIQGKLHQRLGQQMTNLSTQIRWWTPALLGMLWGLIPCGFLYAAQIKAAERGDWRHGAVTMLAFGLGTAPIMLGVGGSASFLSQERRSQLFRMGGWVTLTIGIITLWRTDAMVDYTGHSAIALLILALIARPVARWWGTLLKYRRGLGVGAYVLALAHTAHMLDHSLAWNWQGFLFLPLNWQVGIAAGFAALGLMTPAAVTSFDRLQLKLGKRWRQLHLLSVPALILAAIHTILSGSRYLGTFTVSWVNQVTVLSLVVIVVGVLIIRRLSPG